MSGFSGALPRIRDYLTHATPAQRCIVGMLTLTFFNVAFILPSMP